MNECRCTAQNDLQKAVSRDVEKWKLRLPSWSVELANDPKQRFNRYTTINTHTISSFIHKYEMKTKLRAGFRPHYGDSQSNSRFCVSSNSRLTTYSASTVNRSEHMHEIQRIVYINSQYVFIHNLNVITTLLFLKISLHYCIFNHVDMTSWCMTIISSFMRCISTPKLRPSFPAKR